MSKKKFTDGLESLFDEVAEESVLFVEATAAPKGPQKVTRVRARGSSKDFTADLDTLLEEALQERDEPKTSSESVSKTTSQDIKSPSRTPKRALSGLDALIRKTIEVKMVDEGSGKKATKRVTFAVDKKKLEKLKQIARSQNSYLKDIITQIISDYIKEVEHDKQA